MRFTADYAMTGEKDVKDLIRAYPWATMISPGLTVSHYPLLLDEDADGIVLLGHVGRPDEQLHELGRHELVVVFYGPSGYVSPGWYELPTGVPTWNFEVVHAYGVPEILDDAENLRVLEKLVDHFEDPLPHPFRMRATLANAAYADRIVRGTVGFRLRVNRFEAKNKMSQDKPPQVVDRITEALRKEGPYFNPELAHRIESSRQR
ncbi:FMN-binding negative transcriptional regulator [Kineosporia mesophila]|uniref:FMN-binding negative transcriptional regulator n=1 Tax=Kineosporia mesophila TaxID=566012 RepID=A0ABP6YZL3_9ACTN|nr:FMN-binding negative transcriptional regulator [Kineosporia mesophila]MCD5351009.1 FMN-binding negative transcriptional regulator [Kineosporia mesophila]